jgi:hypothetical protein
MRPGVGSLTAICGSSTTSAKCITLTVVPRSGRRQPGGRAWRRSAERLHGHGAGPDTLTISAGDFPNNARQDVAGNGLTTSPMVLANRRCRACPPKLLAAQRAKRCGGFAGGAAARRSTSVLHACRLIPDGFGTSRAHASPKESVILQLLVRMMVRASSSSRHRAAGQAGTVTSRSADGEAYITSRFETRQPAGCPPDSRRRRLDDRSSRWSQPAVRSRR